MNDFHIDITCPACEKKILVEGNLSFIPSTQNCISEESAVPPTKPRKQKKKIVAKKKATAKKKTSKKGKYDKDLEKLFKLNAGAPAENLKLAPTEAGNSAAALQRMSEAAKKNKKDIKNLPSLEKKIQDWLSGGSNPFSE
jgi:hypothetical protein